MAYERDHRTRAVMERLQKSEGSHKKPKQTIARGVKVPAKKAIAARKKEGGSNVGEYKDVARGDFAGPSGGAPEGSFPINTLKRARAALAYAHNAPRPAGIRRAVYRKFPSLKHPA